MYKFSKLVLTIYCLEKWKVTIDTNLETSNSVSIVTIDVNDDNEIMNEWCPVAVVSTSESSTDYSNSLYINITYLHNSVSVKSRLYWVN